MSKRPRKSAEQQFLRDIARAEPHAISLLADGLAGSWRGNVCDPVADIVGQEFTTPDEEQMDRFCQHVDASFALGIAVGMRLQPNAFR